MDSHQHHNHNDHSNHLQHGSVATTTTSSVVTSSILNSTIENNEMEHYSDGHANHADHNMIMRMYFHGGVQETILFEFWRISESGGLIASMIGIFFLAFAYEAIKFYREHLYRHSFQTVHYNTVTVPAENGTSIKETHKTVQSSLSNTTCFNSHSKSNPSGITPIFISQTTCNCPGPRNQIDGKCIDFSNNNVSSAACDSCPSTPIRIPVLHRAYKVRMFSWMHAWQTFLHMVQVVLSYFLMLIFMTYNVWLCLAVALGAGAGYFFVGWKKSLVVDITEHCH